MITVQLELKLLFRINENYDKLKRESFSYYEKNIFELLIEVRFILYYTIIEIKYMERKTEKEGKKDNALWN